MTELMIRDGDYVPDGKGGLARAEGNDAVLQRVLWKLTVRRGSFPRRIFSLHFGENMI